MPRSNVFTGWLRPALLFASKSSIQHAAVQAAQELLTRVPKHALHEDPLAAPVILEDSGLSLASKTELLLLRLPLEEPAEALLQLASWTQAQVYRFHFAAWWCRPNIEPAPEEPEMAH